MERFGKRTTDSHGLADRLHACAKNPRRSGELLERPPGNLHHHVVDNRLKTGQGGLGDVVGDLIEEIADGELRRDLGDWIPGGLRRQCAGTRHTRVHLDDDHVAVGGVDGELHVGAAGINADTPDAGKGEVAEMLVLHVGEREDRGHRDRVAGVNAHWVNVLDAANNHAVVGLVAHDFELELLPPGNRALHEDLRDRRGRQTFHGDRPERLHRGRNAGSGPSNVIMISPPMIR